jgi:hypothetical protein
MQQDFSDGSLTTSCIFSYRVRQQQRGMPRRGERGEMTETDPDDETLTRNIMSELKRKCPTQNTESLLVLLMKAPLQVAH